jgi:hypothetical protein
MCILVAGFVLSLLTLRSRHVSQANRQEPEIRKPALTQSQPDAKTFILASAILQELYDEAPPGHITLEWLTSSLHKQSFGLIMLMLSVVAATPGISFIGGLLLVIPAFQMIAGSPAPIFPRWIATRPLPTQHLSAVARRAITVLRYVEKIFYPRYPVPPGVTKRVVGIVVMMLVARLMIVPFPISTILPALVIAWISLAYLEEDGLMLSIGLLAGFVVLAVDLWIAWEIVHGAKWIIDLV